MNTNIKRSYTFNIVSIILLFIVMKVLISANILTRYYTGIVIFICINIVLATSLNLATGYLGQLALGHAGFMAVGAYASAITAIALKPTLYAHLKSLQLPEYLDFLPGLVILLISLTVAGIVAGLVGIAIGIPALRLRGDYLGIITLGFGEVIRVVINNMRGLTGGAQGLTGIPRISSFNSVFWITVLVVGILYTLTHSRQGRAIISIREDEIAAEAVGIQTTRYKVMGFAIAAFFAGIGGGLYAHYIAVLDPNTFGFMRSVEILVIVVLGGMGSLTGSIIAAILLTILPEALRDFAEYRLLIYSGLLVVMMIFRPQGIFGTHEFSMSKFVHKLRHNQIISPRKEIKEGE
ncbi:amino acid/amide ABC transporter membrane protein 2, HAAT family (TC 3.A.1.4.-) [Dethiosulfatibacter aminovorans DSM 17477]|uniref:Amino acid/amide ABC transporter membrane protein 2, HAAT family (TC 3.A.1.4.-) n=1 Tax=Dethiosulfatibacter aminovorans DSM 17477 TaxID=1121476 RepID=A0A1M6BUL7_9FIRM|nr:branched-chain amino acid ABC transporter permease [Dethiosulfatibacter aminovorans]SHI52455.1 amino acid/amide ABC transporter membrane protein 2, HAAT family (TC 3.A.1.4.-) [Dethiosulfatibacter aminovorans DSM 17477]